MKLSRRIVSAATALATLGLAAGPMNGVAFAEPANVAGLVSHSNRDLTGTPAQVGPRADSHRGAPGERPSSSTADAPAAHPDGLQPVVNERGHISRSIGATTSDDTSGSPLVVNKPPGATTRAAYLGIATTGFTGTPLTSPVTIDGQTVPLDNETSSVIGSYNYFADVTSLVASTLNAAPAGSVSFDVAESNPSLTEGEVLIVIYDDPSVTVDESVDILYGALDPAGDSYQINLTQPIDLSDPATRLEMSVGISYSCQDVDACGSDQYTSVDVDGARLSTSSGGEDDGETANGSLITVGGEGDVVDNPADPYALPNGPRSDDELYDLRPFVSDGDTQISVATSNPSNDDNVFLTVFYMNPPAKDIVAGQLEPYDQPTTPYLRRSCLLDLSGVPDETVFVHEQKYRMSGQARCRRLKVSFSVDMYKQSVPSSWQTWADIPWTEGDTPDILATWGPSDVTVTFNRNLRRAGFEIEPDPFTVQTYQATMTGAGGPGGTFTRDVAGNAGARLIAAKGVGTQRIKTIQVTDISPGPADFAIARVRGAF